MMLVEMRIHALRWCDIGYKFNPTKDDDTKLDAWSNGVIL